MAAPLTFRLASLEGDNPWIIVQKIFDILREYLQVDSTTSAPEAARAIDSLVPDKRIPEDGVEVEEADDFLFETWDTFFEIAKQIPSNHPSQDRFVELIKALTLIPPRAVIIWHHENKVWKDLPLLGVAFAEAWNEPLNDQNTSKPFEEWVRFNAFAARLLNAGLVPWTNFAFRALREALEEQKQGTQDVQEYAILAGLQWIQYSGSTLARDISDAEISDDDKWTFQGGPLYHGRPELCSERWAFWICRIREMAESSRSQELQECARSAADMMEELK